MNFGTRLRLCIISTLLSCSIIHVHDQIEKKEKKRVSLKDSLDGKLDLSDFIIEAGGFVPIPYILTEPAVGGFGVAIAPVFIKKRPPYIDTIKGKVRKTPVAPDITGFLGMYTLNETWGLFAFRSGTFIKQRLKYVIGGGYTNINMSFYKTLEQVGEREFEFNIRMFPAMIQLIKRLGLSNWYAGAKYLYLKTDVRYVGDHSMDGIIDSIDLKRSISQLGAIVELDNRDNVFTPDKGIKFHTDAVIADESIGSDFYFWRLNSYAYLYTPISNNFIGGLRVDVQQIFGDPPFYMVPFISLRGVPVYRYQGTANILSEVEGRWDITKSKRWSLVFFTGAGKAFDEWSDFGSSKWIFTGGSGIRYLLARKFKLRIGVDVAHGPDTWAYYIVFGSNWLK